MLPFAVVLGAAFLPYSACSASEAQDSLFDVRSQATPLPLYRNASVCVDSRVEDLLQRMTVEDKAGQMFQNSLQMGENYTLFPGSSSSNGTDVVVVEKLMTHFNFGGLVEDAKKFAQWHNLLQKKALDTRLGIPITLTTDPRHHYSTARGATVGAGQFSLWPDTLGFAALRDSELVYKFADIARQEYISVGFRGALHPQVDLATEPRWARIYGTWGEDAHLTSSLISAYIKGFQGKQIGRSSVTTVTKHFPGGGSMENGEDSHFPTGKNETYPGNNFDYHLLPFKAALAAGARQIMPYYSRPINTQFEEVGFSFNRQIVTELLRGKLGFDGIVVTDWGLITDGELGGLDFPARAWGMEDKSELERAAKILDAGCDQFGGETRTELLIQLVREGIIPESRLDISVRKLLKEKFLLGLFDNPFVNPDDAEEVTGNVEFKNLGKEIQRRSYTLLSNRDKILPLRNFGDKIKVYTEGLNLTQLQDERLVSVDSVNDADVALLRLASPYDPRNGTLDAVFGFRGGTLEYSDSEKARQAAIYAAVPTIVDIYVNRPVAVPEVIEQAAAVLASFGSADEAFVDVLFGDAKPEGKLPFDLPRSNAAVEAQMEDVPFDTVNPVFRFGHGLSY
ncbi:unnamed protein product [Clonostachys rhizophaga]|uniref:beta-glucosidase n=1 Tax=Clonostachys rhizophaga TaxID=160324 RepID=A0A9N9YV88_9HYPO|nr:unnamed protein product [Clonostachys rhizophaga]